ncbi:MAG: hypothetical protein E7564_08030 [Ruminococcaceae bacterium]|nr:hypothetical protein [Oscillospiraceae bacterium]
MKFYLNGNDWFLTGWNKHTWLYDRPNESGALTIPLITKISAEVPGAVQKDLLNAGIIKDWNYGFNFLSMEWVEHREWVYEKVFTLNKEEGKRYILNFEGLDFEGFIYLNGENIYKFKGMHIPHKTDITAKALCGKNSLKVVFLQVPEVDGQIGYTSKVNILKSRYNYGWDWMPRMVNIGIFGDVYIECVEKAKIDDVYFRADVKNGKAKIKIQTALEKFCESELKVNHSFIFGDEEIKFEFENAGVNAELEINNVKLWDVTSFGEQNLYTLKTELIADGKVIDEKTKKIGFRDVKYILPEDANGTHYPYSLLVNGKWIPLKGIDWVPLSPFYGTVKESDYRYYLNRLKEMNINLIRVWGGALLEREIFYNICDELGIIVWQEFPQSSSGIDNAPCTENEFVKSLTEAAENFVKLRRNHPSLIYWCGGNELYDAHYVPINEMNKTISALKKVVNKLDPDRIFYPCSPSGEVAEWNNQKAKGVSGDTHGPWTYMGETEHYNRFNLDDSLLHSEVGSPAVPRLETLIKYSEGNKLWPPDKTNDYWRLRGSWWLCKEQMDHLFGEFDGKEKGIETYVKAMRFMQAESLRYSSSMVRAAGRKKSGFIVWMGNEPFPNSANTSVIEFDGCAKPAYYKLKNVFAKKHLALKYDSLVLNKEAENKAELIAFADSEASFSDIKVKVYSAKGEILSEYDFGNKNIEITEKIGEITLPYTDDMLIVRLESGGEVIDEYFFSGSSENPFKPFIEKKNHSLKLIKLGADSYKITNEGEEAALFIDVIALDKENKPLALNQNTRTLFKNESFTVKANKEIAEITPYVLN